MFRSRDGGDFLLKVKSKYIGDTKFDKDDKDKIYDTAVSLKDYRMQTKDKKNKIWKICFTLQNVLVLFENEQLQFLHIGRTLSNV